MTCAIEFRIHHDGIHHVRSVQYRHRREDKCGREEVQYDQCGLHVIVAERHESPALGLRFDALSTDFCSRGASV